MADVDSFASFEARSGEPPLAGRGITPSWPSFAWEVARLVLSRKRARARFTCRRLQVVWAPCIHCTHFQVWTSTPEATPARPENGLGLASLVDVYKWCGLHAYIAHISGVDVYT